MKTKDKTREQLLKEIDLLKIKISELEKSETERKPAEEALRKSEEQYKDLVEKGNIAIVVDDIHGNLIYFNNQFLNLFGFSAEEIKRKSHKIFVHPDNFEIISKYHEKRMQGKETPSRYEFMGIRKDGSIINIEIDVCEILKKEGKISGTRSYMWDITERKQAEKVLAESELQFRSLSDASMEGIGIIQDGNVLIANSKTSEIFGYDHFEIIGKPMIEFVALESRNLVLKNFSDRFKEPFEIVAIRKNGSKFLAEVCGKSIEFKGHSGRVIAIRDITERKKTEKALQTSEERFRQFFANSPEYCFIISLEGTILDINKSALKVLGYLKKEIVGKPLLTTIYTPSSQEKAQKLFVKWRTAGGLRNEELNMITKDGKERTVLLSVDAIRGTKGEIIHSILVQRDITERKQAEEEIIEKSIELEKQFNKSEKQRIATLSILFDLNETTKDLQIEIKERKQAEEQIRQDLEEKNILLQEIHHRVKNNMQIISSLLKLQSAHIKDKRALELFQNSQDRVKTMSLIHDSLYRSKDLAHIDFTEYVRKLATQIFISYGANSNFIKLKIDIKDILMDISTAIPCGLIINELVSNSLKYAFPKGSKGEISISFTYKDQVHTLCVKDNGIGISKKIDLEDSPTLGLMLVNSLTKQLDGTLKLEKGKGTSFKITFKKIELKTYGKVES